MPEIKEVTKNMRVISIDIIDKGFDGCLDEGCIGTVTYVSDEFIGVTLDHRVQWLNPWCNQIDTHRDEVELYNCSCLEELFWQRFQEIEE